ncbi:MAG: cob(I)yrinic acid a,c-diamide adenosyltransferase [Proteobacteria bacterium]|nr:cob(I)yrinic acid a,c-diamide adenosyltransferase [Pseudomonadota bacterium]
MVKLDKIYTRGGDAGTTSLAFGGRVAKHDLRIHAIGEVDEANAWLGVCRAKTDTALFANYDAMLGRIQNDLFDLGADLASPPVHVPEGKEGRVVRITKAQVARLEHEIDSMNASLPALESFVLPMGGELVAHLQVARAVVRRAERSILALADRDQDKNKVGAEAIAYINRLSDHVFVMARAVAETHAKIPLWQPAANA